MAVQALGMTGHRFGHDSNVVAKAFRDDVEMSACFDSRLLHVLAQHLKLTSNAANLAAKLAAKVAAKLAADTANLAPQVGPRRVSPIHIPLELSDRHGFPESAHHSIVGLACRG